MKQHLAVFKDGYGLIKDFKITIHLRPDTTPVFRKARPVPFARRKMVAAELDRLEGNRIITKVERSDWAAPTVNVLKPDKSVRICGDYKVTVNPHVDVDQYPLPTAEDIFSTLAGGVKFTKLDLAHAYNQLELDDASKRLLTINTHKGLLSAEQAQLWSKLGSRNLSEDDRPDTGGHRWRGVLSRRYPDYGKDTESSSATSGRSSEPIGTVRHPVETVQVQIHARSDRLSGAYGLV